MLSQLLTFLLLVQPVTAAEPGAQAPSAPKPLIGVTGALAVPLSAGKPVGLAVGLQTVIPVKSLRFAVEVFGSTPVTAFTPALGGDVGAGLVDRNGVGGVLALYARHTFGREEVVPGTQVGPGLVLVYKIAPTVLFTAPFVVWVDTKTKAVTPTLSLKGVFGAPYGDKKKG